MIGTVHALVVLDGGDMIIGGNFISPLGTPSNIIRHSPSTGAWSPIGSVSGGGTNGSLVGTLSVLPGGDVIVGGRFTSAGGVAAASIARYNPSTEVWSALGSGVGSVYPDGVYALLVLPGGDVIVGGQFTSAGGVAANNIARYDASTGAWSALSSGVTGLFTSTTSVNALALLPGGDVIAAGDFDTAGGMPVVGIARYTPASNTWSSMGTGLVSYYHALAVLPGGDVIAGGITAFAPADGIARYNPTTNAWSSIGGGLINSCFALTVLPGAGGGDVIVGGNFDTAGGLGANRIASYNPSTNAWSALGSGLSHSSLDFATAAIALAVEPGGDVVVGGFFDTAGGMYASGIARYTFANAPAPSIIAQPTGLDLCPSGAGSFIVQASAGRGDPTYVWQWQPDGAGTPFVDMGDGPITNSNDDAWLNVNGSGSATMTITRTSLDGPASSYIPVRCSVSSLCGTVISNLVGLGLQAPPRIDIQPMPMSVCAAGSATMTIAAPNAQTYRWQWRPQGTAVWLDMVNGVNTSPGTGQPAFEATGATSVSVTMTNSVGTSAAVSGGRREIQVIVSNPCGSATSAAAIWTVCPPDFNCSGALEIADIFTFLNAWFAGDLSSDFDGVNGLQVADIFAFLNAWFAGCP